MPPSVVYLANHVGRQGIAEQLGGSQGNKKSLFIPLHLCLSGGEPTSSPVDNFSPPRFWHRPSLCLPCACAASDPRPRPAGWGFLLWSSSGHSPPTHFFPFSFAAINPSRCAATTCRSWPAREYARGEREEPGGRESGGREGTRQGRLDGRGEGDAAREKERWPITDGRGGRCWFRGWVGRTERNPIQQPCDLYRSVSRNCDIEKPPLPPMDSLIMYVVCVLCSRRRSYVCAHLIQVTMCCKLRALFPMRYVSSSTSSDWSCFLLPPRIGIGACNWYHQRCNLQTAAHFWLYLITKQYVL
jgi:hypothetical protein